MNHIYSSFTCLKYNIFVALTTQEGFLDITYNYTPRADVSLPGPAPVLLLLKDNERRWVDVPLSQEGLDASDVAQLQKAILQALDLSNDLPDTFFLEMLAFSSFSEDSLESPPSALPTSLGLSAS